MSETQRQVTNHFDSTAREFDTICSGTGKGRLSRWLDARLRSDMYERFRLTVEAATEIENASVLDVGCGSGRFMAPIAEKGASVMGLDPAPNMIELAREHCAERGVAERCEYVVSDVRSWETDRRFDVVLGIGLFDYLTEPLAELTRMVGLADRRVVLSFPRRWTWRAPVRKIRLGLQGCPVFFYGRQRVRDLVREAGGEIEEFKVVGKLYFVTCRPARPA